MSGLFINYRRDDTAPYAGRICDYLRRSFPKNKVFMDIDGIDPGEDFAKTINQTLALSKVVLVIIGPRWENITDRNGARRLEDPDDYVVRELCAALDSDARVIPILVGGAVMPTIDKLPSRLQPLVRRNAIELSDTRFLNDAERLSVAIAKVIDPSNSQTIPPKIVQPSSTGSESASADSLAKFKIILWVQYSILIFNLIVAIGQFGAAGGTEEGAEEILFLLVILYIIFAAWFNVMLLRGKNWARILYTIMIPISFLSLSDQSDAQVVLNAVYYSFAIWLIRLMFTAPIKSIFQSASKGSPSDA